MSLVTSRDKWIGEGRHWIIGEIFWLIRGSQHNI
jgi:hypothetical protein